MSIQQQYRTVLLSGFGRVKVPAYLSDEEVLAQIKGPTENEPDEEATPAKKTKKKP